MSLLKGEFQVLLGCMAIALILFHYRTAIKSELHLFLKQKQPLLKINQTSQLAGSILYPKSAYAITEKGIVRVVAAGDRKTIPKYTSHCCLFPSNSSTSKSTCVTSRLDQNSVRLSKKYELVYIECPIMDVVEPKFVSVLHSRLIPITYNWRGTLPQQRRNTFVLCQSPFFDKFNKHDWLLHYIAVNRALGVEHFIFYLVDAGQRVRWVLEQMARQGEATLVDWRYPAEIQRHIRWGGQVTAYNDCHHRVRGRFEFVVYTDIDEFVVPRKSASLQEMICLLYTSPSPRD